MAKLGSITYQISQRFNEMNAIGRSKHIAKQHQDTRNKMFNYDSMKQYQKIIHQLKDFAETEKGGKIKTVKELKKYAIPFLKNQTEKGLAVDTIKGSRSAFNKFFDTKIDFYVKDRQRAEFTKSRNMTKEQNRPKKRYNLDKWRPVIEFNKACGLRRSEIENVHKEALKKDEKGYYLDLNGKRDKTKHGKDRKQYIVADEKTLKDIIQKFQDTPDGCKVWGKQTDLIDFHHLRHIYAQKLYKKLERPLNTLKREEKYYCRGDLKGVVYDREALRLVGLNLGHGSKSMIRDSKTGELKPKKERLDVVVSNYLN